MASDRIQRQVERLLDKAEDAVAKRNWAVVRDLAQDVLALDPENPDGLAFVAAAERALRGSATLQSPEDIAAPADTQAPEPELSAPTSFADARYEVKKFLGEGAKKKVYLAHDTLLDREVAVALIKTEGLDEAGRTRITREAQAMGRLGSHPHIVTVFDLGKHEGQPYMVTELMDGGDVESTIGKAPDSKLDLEQTLEIAKAVCRGLAFAHSKEIVHRDIKPGNVWLTSEGVAKVGDFGLAIAVDRSRLTQEGMMVGTVSYMPPEQALGSEVTPQADLYSLGAMLYEMVTARPPFLGDDPVAIISQHINTAPVAPSWHNAQCPKPLEALILRLLAKDPSERPESAADVLTALEAIDPTAVVQEEAEEAHILDSLAGGVFVGRQREMGELKAALEDALSGRGRMVTLVGEPGIGKTRTAQELATYTGLRQAQVLWGRCYEGRGVPPYWPWVQAIRSYVREHDPDQLRSEMGTGAADIAEIISDVKERLPDLEPPPKLEPEAARFRLFDSITSFLKGASQTKPLVLVLDDLHWADESSLLLLQFLARELARSRLLVVGTYRDVEISRKHPLAEVLGELTKERLFQRILLRGLKQEDVGRFIELTSAKEPPAGLVEAVYTQTEGNPLFVTEIVRLLVQEEELTDEARKRESWTVRIPEGVREVIGRRLNRLSERCNQTLTIAAVIGREFELRQVQPLIEDLTEDMLLDVLEEALEARIVEELPQVMGRYQFTHALIQETLTGELSLTRRVRLHARIAKALEKLYGDQAEAHAAELAQHFAEAQEVLGTEKLLRYSLLAGERALTTYAYEEAVAHFQRGL
ncbi:MAG: protein kinase, partial [Dehalococcoidia bacterium]